MLDTTDFTLDDPDLVRDLVRRNPWALLVSAPGPDRAPVVSHLPILVDDGQGVAIRGHVGRPDAHTHELGTHPVTVVVQGPHGYVSPSFYGEGPYVPTWNYVVAHIEGVPEVLDGATTYELLSATVDHLEAGRPNPWALTSVQEHASRIAGGTVGFRLSAARVRGRAKLSQDKPAHVRDRVVAALETDSIHGNSELAEAMRRSAGS